MTIKPGDTVYLNDINGQEFAAQVVDVGKTANPMAGDWFKPQEILLLQCGDHRPHLDYRFRELLFRTTLKPGEYIVYQKFVRTLATPTEVQPS